MLNLQPDYKSGFKVNVLKANEKLMKNFQINFLDNNEESATSINRHTYKIQVVHFVQVDKLYKLININNYILWYLL